MPPKRRSENTQTDITKKKVATNSKKTIASSPSSPSASNPLVINNKLLKDIPSDSHKEKNLKHPWRFECLYCGGDFVTMETLYYHVFGKAKVKEGTNEQFLDIECKKRKETEEITCDELPLNYKGPDKYPWAQVICYDVTYQPDNPNPDVPSDIERKLVTWHIDGRNQ